MLPGAIQSNERFVCTSFILASIESCVRFLLQLISSRYVSSGQAKVSRSCSLSSSSIQWLIHEASYITALRTVGQNEKTIHWGKSVLTQWAKFERTRRRKKSIFYTMRGAILWLDRMTQCKRLFVDALNSLSLPFLHTTRWRLIGTRETLKCANGAFYRQIFLPPWLWFFDLSL